MPKNPPEPFDEVERQRLRYIVERLNEALTLAETVPGDLGHLLALARRAAEEALDTGRAR